MTTEQDNLKFVALSCLQGLLANQGLINSSNIHDANLVDRAFLIAEIFIRSSEREHIDHSQDRLTHFKLGDTVAWVDSGIYLGVGRIHTIDSKGLLIDWDVSDKPEKFNRNPPFYVGLESLDKVKLQA